MPIFAATGARYSARTGPSQAGRTWAWSRSPSWNPLRFTRDGAREDTDAGDLGVDPVTDFQERSFRHADAGWRAGQDHVAGIERHDLGCARDLLGDRVDHLAGAAVLL